MFDFPSRRLDYARTSVMPAASSLWGKAADLARRYGPGVAAALATAGAAEYEIQHARKGSPTSMRTLPRGIRGRAVHPYRVLPSHYGNLVNVPGLLDTYAQLRAAGLGHKAAKRAAWARSGLFLPQRRVRSTNVRALRRSIRRLRGARKLLSRIRGLQRPRLVAAHFRRKKYRRGDVDAFYPSFNPPYEDADLEPSYELEEDGYAEEPYFLGAGE